MATTARVSFTIDASGAQKGATDIATAIAKIEASLVGLETKAKSVQAGFSTSFKIPGIATAVAEIRSLETALNSIRMPPGIAQLSQAIGVARAEIISLTAAVSGLSTALASANTGAFVSGMGAASTATKSLGHEIEFIKPLITGLAGIFAIEGIAKFGEGIYTATQRFQSFRQTLKAVTDSPAQFNKEMKLINDTVFQLGLDLGTTQDSFAKFFASAKLSKEPIENINKIFVDMSQAMTVFGLSVSKQQYVWIALEQMFNKGTIQAEELKRQLGNELPGAFEQFAASIGKTPAELTKAMKAGEVKSTEVVKFAEFYINAFKKGLPDAMAQARVGVGQLTDAWTAFMVTIGNNSLGAFGQSFKDIAKEIVQTTTDAQGLVHVVTDDSTGIPKLTKKFQDLADTVTKVMSDIFTAIKPVFDFLLDHSKLIGDGIELYLGLKVANVVGGLALAFDKLVKSMLAYKLIGTLAPPIAPGAAPVVPGAAAPTGAAPYGGNFGQAVVPGITAAGAAATAAAKPISSLMTIFKSFISGNFGTGFAAIGTGLIAFGKGVIAAVAPFVKFELISAAVLSVADAFKTFFTTTGTFSERLEAATSSAVDLLYQFPLLGDALHLVIHDWLGVKTVTEEAAEAGNKNKTAIAGQKTAYDSLSDAQKKVADDALAAGKAVTIQTDSVTDATKKTMTWQEAMKAAKRPVEELGIAGDSASGKLKSLEGIRLDKAMNTVRDLANAVKDEMEKNIQKETGKTIDQLDKLDRIRLDKSENAVAQWALRAIAHLAEVSDSSTDTERVMANVFKSAANLADTTFTKSSASEAFLETFHEIAASAGTMLEKFHGIEFDTEKMKSALASIGENSGKAVKELSSFNEIQLDNAKNIIKSVAETAKEQLENQVPTSVGKAKTALGDLNNAQLLDNAKSGIDAWAQDAINQLSAVAGSAEAVRQKLAQIIALQQQSQSESAGIPAYASGGMYGPGMMLVGEQGPEIMITKEPGYVINNSQTEKMLRRATGGPVPAGTPTMVGEAGIETFIPGGQFDYSRSGYQADTTSASSGSTSGRNDMAILPPAGTNFPKPWEKDIFPYAVRYKKNVLDEAVNANQMTSDQSSLVMSSFREVADDWSAYKSGGPKGQVGIAKDTNGMFPYFENVRKLENMYSYIGPFIAAAYGGALSGDISNPFSTSVKSSQTEDASNLLSQFLATPAGAVYTFETAKPDTSGNATGLGLANGIGKLSISNLIPGTNAAAAEALVSTGFFTESTKIVSGGNPRYPHDSFSSETTLAQSYDESAWNNGLNIGKQLLKYGSGNLNIKYLRGLIKDGYPPKISYRTPVGFKVTNPDFQMNGDFVAAQILNKETPADAAWFAQTIASHQAQDAAIDAYEQRELSVRQAQQNAADQAAQKYDADIRARRAAGDAATEAHNAAWDAAFEAQKQTWGSYGINTSAPGSNDGSLWTGATFLSNNGLLEPGMPQSYIPPTIIKNGYATGGQFDVGGAGGIDSQLVQFKASPGERVKISQAANVRHGNDIDDENGVGGGGNHIEIHIHGVEDFNSFRRSEKQMMSRLNKALHNATKGV